MEEKKELTGASKRRGTDSQGRAIYECADCATIDGAPYTQGLDGGHRCSGCARAYDTRRAKGFKMIDQALGIMFPGPVAALQRAAREAKAEERTALLEQLRTTTLALELVLAQPPSSDFEWAAIRATVQTSKNLIAKVEG